MKDLLNQLTQLYGPSGFEGPVRAAIRELVTPLADDIHVDAMGNLHAVKNGTGDGKKIMVAAHMDEIGLMVTDVDKGGFLRFTNLGGLFPGNLVGQRVRFENDIIGVISIEKRFSPGGGGKPEGPPAFKNLFIDVGAHSKDDCPVKVGDVAGFVGAPALNGRRYIAKSLDDRVGCALQIETMRRLKSTPHEIHFVFTVQEEVGLRGAKTSAFQVAPDIGIALDLTPTGDLPESKHYPVALGKGPAIKVKDVYTISHPAVKDWMVATAEALALPYQLEILLGGGTDAQAIQLAGSGAAAGTLSIPSRHVHTPAEMIDLDDLEKAAQLLVEMLSNPVPESLA